jgi:DNA repair exonuclease SbcCD nuclease subunit
MKVIHAADLHLDSPMRGLVQYEGAPVDLVRSATRRAFAALVDLCIEEEAALLLIAGDLYDGDFRDYSTALCFTEQMGRLRETGTKVIWLRGNHDAANKITKHLRSAEHVHELSHESPQSILIEELGIAVHGQGYATRDVTDNLALSYPTPCKGLLNFGLLHTALDGREGHAPYAPCALGELQAKGYDYWALGHIHKREVVAEDPFVVFPGNLQGRHIRETGPKGVTLITIESGKIAAVEERSLDCVRWELSEVDVSRATHLSDVLDAAIGQVARHRDRAGDRVLATRIRLVGASAAHGTLSRDHSKLENELRAYAVDQGDIYVERVKIATVGALSAEALASRRDALGDLFRDIDAIEGDDEAKKELWEEVVRPLSSVSADLLRAEEIDPDEVLREARSLLEGRLLEAPLEET